jgi:hypothetical protein
VKRLSIIAAGVLLLTGCTSSDSSMRMLEIYVDRDTTPYVDVEQVTNGKNTVVVDDEKNLRVFLYGSSSCPPLVERIVTDEENAFIYVETYEGEACTKDYALYAQKVTHVNAGNFEDLKSVSVCTTDEDCVKIDNLIFNRLV